MFGRRQIGLVVVGVLLVTAAVVTASPTGGTGSLPPGKTARRHLDRLGSNYTAHIDHGRKLIFISALDRATLQNTITALSVYADMQRRHILTSRPEWYLTIVLPTREDFQPPASLAKAVGYYQPATRTLTSIDRGSTLVHEFTHALHDVDQSAANQRHPIWIWEGLATTFEAVRFGEKGRFEIPLSDWRLGSLQQALRDGTAPSLEQISGMGQAAFMANPAVDYATSRYVIMYLRHKGVLRRWYGAYKSTFSSDPSGIESMARVLGQSPAAFEKDWQQWVLSLDGPAPLKWDGAAKLGIEMTNHAHGVRVVGMLETGAAAQAGRLKIGDVIYRYNGTEARNPAQLGASIRATGELQTVDIELYRNGRRMKIIQPLGAIQR